MGRQPGQGVANWKRVLENLFVVVLAFYPLRHISWGLDLWDTGYNYANFQYMGTEHMDSMWLFSTYLANGVGNLLTKLPGGGTLVGMNFYTGLSVSILAPAGYFFCTRSLKIPSWIAFVGELVAVSLCWCPTALLYNYLTYMLFLGCTILLYHGLTKEKKGCLIAAGICLGANVLVRFSNLPEAALIVAVWAYDVICRLEEGKRLWKRLLSHTGWCLLGYLGALAVLFGWIQIRYGLSNYVEGIGRLFAMTDTATDYKATSMILNLVDTYVENMYWVVRIGIILAGGLVLFAAAGWLESLLNRKASLQKAAPALRMAVRALWVVVSLAMVGWLYYRGFCSLEFYSYGSILRPGVLFLMLTMLIGLIRIFHPDSPKEEKLISGMLILIIILTALGSNNKVYPSLNNLFVAAPYTLWESWRFISGRRERQPEKSEESKKLNLKLIINPFPAKGLLAAFLAMCLFQFGAFGAKFVFAEATGVQDISAAVENNQILKNVKMSPEKAQWMTEISGYVNENDLRGEEVILYGRIPSLSYYLQMPSAFNPWSDLDSYSIETMKEALLQLSGEIAENKEKAPVIILEKDYWRYMEEGMNGLEASGVDEAKTAKIVGDDKLPLLWKFMETWNYQKVFENGKFVIYR